MIAETSRTRYHELVATGDLSRQQAELLSHMTPGKDYTRAELSRISGMMINVVTGRVNELIEAGKLEEQEGEKRRCEVTGYTAKVVRLSAEGG